MINSDITNSLQFTPNVGSNFVVGNLPSGFNLSAPSANPKTEMINVLVVDDEIDICNLLTQYLRKLGFQAGYCLTILEANQKLGVFKYDLFFVDLNLTDGSGYDLINSIRLKDKTSKIIVISAHESERHKVLEEGASLYVPKPFSNRSIREALEKLDLLKN